MKIGYYTGNDSKEKIRNLKAQIFYKDNEGHLQRKKLGRNDFFDEKVNDNVRMKRFSFPNLQPGAIIEWAYELESENRTFLDPWSFQSEIPTLVSKFEIHTPSLFIYNLYPKGDGIFAAQEEERYSYSYPFRADYGALGSDHGSVSMETTQKIWVKIDVPALRPEPHVSTIENYRNQIQFQLAFTRDPNSGQVRPQLGSWDQLISLLKDADSFGKQLNLPRKVRKELPNFEEDYLDEYDRMIAIYDFVRSSFSWNQRVSMYSEVGMGNFFRDKTGNSADMNMFLISLLRESHIDANPVLISSRNNGFLIPGITQISQFNNTIAAVHIGDQRFFMDACDPSLPFSLLPEYDLNGVGIEIYKDQSHAWVELPKELKMTEKFL